ncbi:GrxA family glutaredoxin [Arsenophonus symbiont of Ornithomya chloropus]|uniref:GrxA family glutaredoxin n=1 Tax=Arsenophonus symbiont of Ornithomya chloropus TaxID=634121 RepID=UPI0032B279B6
MFLTIFGRSGCPYCISAKKIAEKLKNTLNDFDYNYIDIEVENITKNDLSKKVGKIVKTVPQIFLDEKYIGGFTDFEKYVQENLLIL